MKLLLSAYACAPDEGSEPLVGFMTAVTAASEHHVWVLTQQRMVQASRAEFGRLGLAGRVTVVGIGPDATEKQSGLSSLALTHLRHEWWQRNARLAGRRLHADVGFDLAHHVTLAAYWMPCGIAALPIPLVWGPVGGGVETPFLLLPELGPAGCAEDVARRTIRRVWTVRPAVRALPRRATVTFVQNAETAARVPQARPRVLSNALTSVLPRDLPVAPRGRDIVVVSRLDAWKGTALALRVLTQLGPECGVMRVFGDGRERSRLQERVKAWGLGDRVVFEGRRSRTEAVAAIATAGALLHPSFHEEGGGAVAEALCLGTPVVCLARGGPAILPDEWPETPAWRIQPTSARLLARRLAAAVTEALRANPPTSQTGRAPVTDFRGEFLAAYTEAVRSP